MEKAGHDRGAPKLCPSAQPGMDNCRVLGVVQHDAPIPMLLYLKEPVPATADVLAPGRAARADRGVSVGGDVRDPLVSAFRRRRLPAGHAHRQEAASRGRCAAAVHHSQGLPVVLARGGRRVSAVPAGHHGDVRPLARDAGGFGIADRRGPIDTRDSPLGRGAAWPPLVFANSYRPVDRSTAPASRCTARARRQRAIDDLSHARRRASRVVPPPFLLVASRARQRQIARILGAAGDRPQAAAEGASTQLRGTTCSSDAEPSGAPSARTPSCDRQCTHRVTPRRRGAPRERSELRSISDASRPPPVNSYPLPGSRAVGWPSPLPDRSLRSRTLSAAPTRYQRQRSRRAGCGAPSRGAAVMAVEHFDEQVSARPHPTLEPHLLRLAREVVQRQRSPSRASRTASRALPARWCGARRT